MNLDIFSNKDNIEQEYILKYFFLTDPIALAKDIIDKLPTALKDITDIDSFFHITFEKLYNYLGLYSDFISTNGNLHTFFGESVFDSDTLTVLSYLLKLSLYNFCISEGFFYFLENDCFYNANRAFYPLTATYKDYFRTGFFSTPIYDNETSKTVDADIYNRALQQSSHRISLFSKLKEDSFLRFVIRDCIKNDTDKNKQYYDQVIEIAKKTTKVSMDLLGFSPDRKRANVLYVPNIYKFPAYTYFTERSLSSLSKNMERTLTFEREGKPTNSSNTNNTYKNIISLYSNLYNALTNSGFENLSDSKADLYTFCTLNERYFGFSTVSYIAQKYAELDFTDHNTIFYETLTDLSLCPLVYNRHFFLQYALEAVKNNKVLETQFLAIPSNVKIAESASEKQLTTAEINLRKQNLIKDYFRMLNRMVLPLFSALWKTTLSHLMDSLKIEKPIEIFQLYIENHFELQTADFTTLSSDELIHCLNLHDKSNDRNAYWTVFVAEIENIYCNNQKSPLNLQNYDKCENPLNLPNQLDFSKLLRDFLLRPQNYTREMDNSLPIYSYFAPTDFKARRNPYNRRIIDFQNARAKNIYDYCTKLLIL